MGALQRRRRLLQAAFFALFLAAPALDLLRFDLHEAQLWFLGGRWTLGIDALARGEATSTETALSILFRGILPAVSFAAAFLFIASRFGRVYCGWLCPHFSLVETINGILHRASGRFSLWESRQAPSSRSASGVGARGVGWWALFILACAGFGTLWAVTLLTYLLPPAEIWGGIVNGTLTANQARFIAIASLVFTLELAFARHLFCRFGCAVGLFQSLAWMANPRALVVTFDRRRATDCRDCTTARAPEGNACDTVCPMRLQPRRVKRQMFSCVQCGRCLEACDDAHAAPSRGSPTLQWTVGVDALRETLRRRSRP